MFLFVSSQREDSSLEARSSLVLGSMLLRLVLSRSSSAVRLPTNGFLSRTLLTILSPGGQERMVSFHSSNWKRSAAALSSGFELLASNVAFAMHVRWAPVALLVLLLVSAPDSSGESGGS